MAGNVALKLAIFESGQTQSTVSARAGISENKLSRIIRGRDTPRPDEQRAIAKILRRPVAQLFPEEVAS